MNTVYIIDGPSVFTCMFSSCVPFTIIFEYIIFLQEGSEILDCMRDVEAHFRKQMEKYLPSVLYYRKSQTTSA